MKHVPHINDDDRYSDRGNYAIGGEEYLSFGNRMGYVMLSYWN